MAAKAAITPASIREAIRQTLDGVFGFGHGVDTRQLAQINRTLAPVFASLPKNRAGRLEGPSMRYMVQRYFSQEHGWIVKGFEPHLIRSQDKHVDGSQVLLSDIPSYVEEVLSSTLAHDGF